MNRLLAVAWLFIVARQGCDAQTEPVPAPEVDCFAVARQFFGTADDLIEGPGVTGVCPGGLPGTWSTCDAACAEGMQVALDELDCCLREYLNEFAGAGSDHGAYADRAFANVIPLCELDLSDTDSVCFDQFEDTETGTDSEEAEPDDACTEAAQDFYGSADDLIQGPDVTYPCPSGLPGVWDTCSVECADGMQAALDELDCCLREYLNEFAGPGEHGTYADIAFSNVIPLCNLDATESSCFDEFDSSVSEAARFSTSLISFGSLFTIVTLWSL